MFQCKRPKTISNFAVTYRCDSGCKTRNIWRVEKHDDELSLEEVEAIFKRDRGFFREVKSVQITGGEPFLRDDLPEIIHEIHSQLPNCRFWIPTNGLNPSKIVEASKEILQFLNQRLLGISVSMDGVGATHDSIRGVKGSFTKTIETLDKLSSMRASYPKLDLAVGMTVTPENSREIEEVYKISKSFGAEFSFRPVNVSDLYYKNGSVSIDYNDHLSIIAESLEHISRDIIKRRGIRGSLTTLSYMRNALDYMRSRNNFAFRCLAGTESIFLDLYGRVYPCIFMDHIMGNLREASLKSVWNSPKALEVRRRIRRGECPRCWVECEAFRSLIKDWRGLAKSAYKALSILIKG